MFLTKRLIVFTIAFISSHIAYSQCTILAYPFNGNANDSTVNGLDGTVIGAQLTSDRFGNPNSAYQFDGVDDYIDAENAIDLSQHNAITISAWFNPSATDNNFIKQTGISIGTKLTGELMLRSGYPGDDKFQAALADGTYSSANGAGRSVKSDSIYNFNQWYHLVGIYTDNKVELWINGVQQGDSSQNLGGAILSTVPSTSSLWIGKSVNPNKTKFFKGKIDDVVILGCAADSLTVYKLFTASSDSTPCTIVSYPFNGHANDISSNNFNATVNGATLTTDRFGNLSNAYSFDGIDDYIDAGNIINVSQESVLMVSAWFAPSITDNNHIKQSGISIGTKSTGELMLRTGYPGADKFQAALADGTYNSANGAGRSVRSNSQYTFNTWYHLVAVYTDSKVELWVDGVQQTDSSQNLGGANMSMIPDTAHLWIGKSVNPNKTKFFKGKIDDILIMRCTPDSTMIYNLFNSSPLSNDEFVEFKPEVQLFPNPASHKLNVVVPSHHKPHAFQIHNAVGKLVISGVSDSFAQGHTVDISNLPAGLYSIIIETDAKGITGKFIIE